MIALLLRLARTIGDEGLDQDDHLAAVSGPLPGFDQCQGHMVIGAAFAATDTGKMGTHE
ncbi:hypothetical protein QNM99_00250 [Pseudomonas sp. PCH446]